MFSSVPPCTGLDCWQYANFLRWNYPEPINSCTVNINTCCGISVMITALQPDCTNTGAWGHLGRVSSTKWKHSKAKLTPSLLQPVKVLGWKVYTCKLANSIFDGPVTNLLSILCILIEILSCARQSWGKAFMISSLALLLVFFRVMAWQAWQWKG